MAGTDFSHLTNDELIKGIQALKLPDYIRSKAYGVDVRETLAQMTEMLMQLAYNQGMSPQQAKEWVSQLNNKIDKGNLSVADINKNLGKLDQTFMTDEFLQQMVGNTPVNAVPADGSITNKKLADKSVDESKVTFFGQDENIFSGVYSQSYLGGNAEDGGQLNYSRDTARSAIIRVEPNTNYKIKKDPSDRFRVATFTEVPRKVSPTVSQPVNRYLRDEYVPNETTETEYKFSTLPDEYYVVITVSLLEGSEPFLSLSVDDTYNFNKNIKAENIVMSNNLFDNNYHDLYIKPVSGGGEIAYSVRDSTAIIQISPNTTYSISKTSSNRFRVALSETFPEVGNPVEVIKSEGDSDLSFTFTSGLTHHFLIIFVSSGGIAPIFMQVNEGNQPTKWETYGYKLYPQAMTVSTTDEGGGQSDGTVYVEDYRIGDESDSLVIQKAFDSANGQVVSLKSGKTYLIDDTITAHASRVRGIEGNNALLKGTGSHTVLTYTGSKTSGSAMPQLNNDIVETEMSVYLKNIRIMQANAFTADGIKISGTFSLFLQNIFVSKARNAITFTGWNRNINIADCNIYNNSGVGLFFKDANIHQINISGCHISYNQNEVQFSDSNIANVQISGCDLESSKSNTWSGTTESIISFVDSGESSSIYEVIIISGSTIQEHYGNQKPIINIDLRDNRIHELIIDGNLIGNSSADSVPVYLKGANGVSVSNNSIVGYKEAISEYSVVLEGKNDNVRILNNHLDKPINYSGLVTNKALIANNLTEGFTMADSNSNNIKVVNNF